MNLKYLYMNPQLFDFKKYSGYLKSYKNNGQNNGRDTNY